MVFIKKTLVAFILVIGLMLVTFQTDAQCAMCTLNAENSTKEGNMQGKGLNNGILFLLSMPFLIGAGVGLLWYTRFRVSPDKENLPE